MSITRLDHVTQGLNRLTSFFDDSDNFRKLTEILLEEFQEIEDVILALAGQKDLNTVEGVWLDYLGELLDEARSARSDDEYRKALQLKVNINTSDSTHPSVSTIIRDFTKSDQVHLVKGSYQWGQIIFDGETNDGKSLWELVENILPVTTDVVVMQDTAKSCFFPAWEDPDWEGSLFLGLHTGATFGVTSDINEGVVELSLNTGPYSNEVGVLPNGRNTPSWEEPESFGLYDGSSLQFSDEDGLSDYYLSGYSVNNNATLLPWEISETTSSQAEPIVEDFYIYLEDGVEYKVELQIDENTIDTLQVQRKG